MPLRSFHHRFGIVSIWRAMDVTPRVDLIRPDCPFDDPYMLLDGYGVQNGMVFLL